MRKKKHFLNLTNGIQALVRFNLNIEEVNFIRIQSCWVESHKFEDMLNDLDHNFLMSLALGYDCYVYDFGARSEISKATYYGLEWVRYVLYRRWFNKVTNPIVKGKRVDFYFDQEYRILSRRVKTKIDYYKKYLLTDDIYLQAVTDFTTNDNKPDYFREILETQLNSE